MGLTVSGRESFAVMEIMDQVLLVACVEFKFRKPHFISTRAIIIKRNKELSGAIFNLLTEKEKSAKELRLIGFTGGGLHLFLKKI